jgi:hypothetical protein
MEMCSGKSAGRCVREVFGRGDVDDFGCDGGARGDGEGATCAQVDVLVRGAPLFVCANHALVVRSDKDVDILEIELLQEHEAEFEGDGLQPTYVDAVMFPPWYEPKCVPALADDDCDAPRGAGVDVYAEVAQRPEGLELADIVGLRELLLSPGEGVEHGV